MLRAGAQAPAAAVDNRLPCEKTPYMPSFSITLPDTLTKFNTSSIPEGKKSVFIIFGPDCSHCRDFIRELYLGIDTLKNYNFYLITPIRNPFALINFDNAFKPSAHKNIKAVGRDLDFFVMDYFGVRNFPAVVLYDEHKMFLRGIRPETALAELHD